LNSNGQEAGCGRRGDPRLGNGRDGRNDRIGAAHKRPGGEDPRRGRGQAGEEIACGRLEHGGYTIIDRNYRTRFGELDIIARQGDTVAFIEVKARIDKSHGEPFEAVTWRKQGRIRRVAEAWLMANERDENYRDCVYRFDVVSILLDSRGGARVYEHIIDAFR
jgi:putative endonuclease